MSKKNDDRKNIVVVGGGFAGSTITRTFLSKLDTSKYTLTLITSHPYFVHYIAGARLTVSDADDLENLVFVPYDKLFADGKGTHKAGTVTAIEEAAKGQSGFVVLQDGEKVPYDALALAPGTLWSGPLNFPSDDASAKASIREWRRRYADAKEVVLVGGGAVGIETAGEVREAYPDKRVTIIHGGDLLLNEAYPDKFRKDIERRLKEKNIDVILGEFIDEIPEYGTKGLKTRSGKELPNTDLVVPTSGGRPNTGFIASLGSDVLTERGHVKVKPTLELLDHPGIFAAGDVINWKEQKQAAKTAAHAAVVVANITSYLTGKPLTKVYKGSFEMIAIPIGKSGGASYFDVLWGILLGGWITSALKGKTLMVSQARKVLGY